MDSELSYDPQHEYYSTWLEFINHGVSSREWKYYARPRSSSQSCVSLLLNSLNTIEKEADPVVSPMILYAIKDTETGEFWMNSKGRSVWKRKVDAINSWNAVRDWPRLSDQRRWKVVPVALLTLGWS